MWTPELGEHSGSRASVGAGAGGGRWEGLRRAPGGTRRGMGVGDRRALGRSEARGSPGRPQTLCGDVTPELETMINMIICIKSEWVLFSGRMPRMMNGPGSQIDG